MNVLDAAMFRAMIRSGAIDLQRHSEEVNRLNVFPVPDGDTGLNMLSTIRGGVASIDALPSSSSLGECAKALSRGMLLAARGNSGVILSQFFAGLVEPLYLLQTANVMQFAQAFEAGVKRAYDVVVKPVEGTILTVMREGGQYALERLDSATTFEDYFTFLLHKMKSTLLSTPDLLPILKEAGVIDSGGAGLLYIIEGMAQAIGGKIIEDVSLNLSSSNDQGPSSIFNYDADTPFEYGYCTEFILQLTNEKQGVKNFNLDELILYYGTLGDSLVAFMDGTLVKVHVHTKTPDKVLTYALRYGEFVHFKMENMTLQHRETLVEKSHAVSMLAKPESVRRRFASIAVAPNEKAAQIFRDYGVHIVLVAGELMNPGTEEFLNAYKTANADDIFVFPNNKNEILVAELAAEMFQDGAVHIVPSDDIAEGIASASVLDFADLGLDENLSRALGALHNAKTFRLYCASRDSRTFGTQIHKGDFVFHKPDGSPVLASSPEEAFDAWFAAQEGDLSLVTLLFSNRVNEASKAHIRKTIAARDDFLEIQEFDIGDCLFEFYAILD